MVVTSAHQGGLAATAQEEATCTGTATANCFGTADIVSAAVPATCTGTATNGSLTCDLLPETDSSADCPAGCASTEAVAEVPGNACDLDVVTDGTAECAAGCARGEYVSKFTVQYSTDGSTWRPIQLCAGGICATIEYDGNSDPDIAQAVVFLTLLTARYLRLAPTADGVVGSATIRGAIQTCGGRADGVCAFDVQTYGGAATAIADVLADVDAASWTSLTAQTAPTTQFIGSTQAPQEAQFVRLTTDCDGTVSIAELEIFAQACDCADAAQLLWATDGAGGCEVFGEGR